MRNPYDVLGVPRTADAAAIKSAFRKLAKKLHPDANKDDPKSAKRFAEVNSAYEILGDDKKRKAFDRGEIDAEGKPRFQGFEGFHPGAGGGPGAGPGGVHFENFSFGPEGLRRGAGGRAGGFGGFEDILKDMFGGAGTAQARRSGFGPQAFEGEEFQQRPAGRDVEVGITISLSEAAKGGTRRVHLPTGKEVEVKIPPGLSDGQQIRLKGQGLPGPGAVGDALVTITIAPHPFFERDGANLRLDLPITLYEAVLGGKVRVPTLDGAVEIAIPPGTSSGRTFRLKGKGLPEKSGTGDLLASVRIVLPKDGDRDLEELMRRWRESRSYDPRVGME